MEAMKTDPQLRQDILAGLQQWHDHDPSNRKSVEGSNTHAIQDMIRWGLALEGCLALWWQEEQDRMTITMSATTFPNSNNKQQMAGDNQQQQPQRQGDGKSIMEDDSVEGIASSWKQGLFDTVMVHWSHCSKGQMAPM